MTQIQKKEVIHEYLEKLDGIDFLGVVGTNSEALEVLNELNLKLSEQGGHPSKKTALSK